MRIILTADVYVLRIEQKKKQKEQGRMSVRARRKERDQTHRVVACQYETYRFDPQTGTKT